VDIRIRIDAALDGPENMARDLELFEGQGIRARVYFWDGPWVSLGRNQSPREALIRSVVRPTGGLHGHDVTVGFAMPFRGGVKAAYRAATRPLNGALRACGLPVVLAENFAPVLGRVGSDLAPCQDTTGRVHRDSDGRGTSPGDCFAGTSLNDLVHEKTGAKVCGCALKVSRDRLLLQASIPCREPLIDPSEAIQGALAGLLYPWDEASFPDAFRAILQKDGSYALR
jgi:lipoate-protein ligase A